MAASQHRNRRVTLALLPVLLCFSLGAFGAVEGQHAPPPPKFRWAAARYSSTAPRPLPGAGGNGPVSASGTIAAAQATVALPVSGSGTVACQITGTWVATLAFEGTVDNVNWGSIRASAIASDTLVTSTASNGLFILGPGLTSIRVRASAYTSGTATVTLLGTPGAGVTYPLSTAGSVGASSAVTIADAADVALGATGDVAVQGDNTGTVSAKLRGLNKSIATGLSVTQGTSPWVTSGTVTANQGGAPWSVSASGTFGVTQSTSPWVVAGGVAPGAAVSQNPVLVAGQFGGNIKMFGLTTAGELLVSATTPLIVNASGNAASGAALTGNPVLVAGSDGTNARNLSTDTGGRLWARPADSTGAALFPDGTALADAAANPTLTRAGIFPFTFNGTTWDRQRSTSSVTGTTGTGLLAHGPLLWDLAGATNYVRQAGDGSGRTIVVGGAAAGAAVTGNPLLVGMSDGTNAQTLKQSPATLAVQTVVGVPLFQMGLYGSSGNQCMPWGAVNGQGDGGTGSATAASGGYYYNGTNWDRTRGTAAGGTWVQGPAAAGAALAGNPLRVGVSDGTNAQDCKQPATNQGSSTLSGIICTAPMLVNGTTSAFAQQNAAIGDGGGGNNIGAITPYLWNGASMDRVRNNVEATLLASASRTTTQTSADIITYNAGAITVIYDNTVGSTYSDTLTINGKDPASGKYYLLLSSAAIATVTTNVYTVDPAIPAVANVTAQKRLPRTIQLVVTAGNANAHTYSVGYCLQPT